MGKVYIAEGLYLEKIPMSAQQTNLPEVEYHNLQIQLVEMHVKSYLLVVPLASSLSSSSVKLEAAGSPRSQFQNHLLYNSHSTH